jgi:SagB-type dehydrogenase family enzyme
MPRASLLKLDELRPLITAIPREESGTLVFAVGDRDVRVEGDLGMVQRVVSMCDGRRTVGQLAEEFDAHARQDVCELVGALAEHDVLIDCTQAYRLFHWQSSTSSPYYRPLDDGELAALAAESFRPARLEEAAHRLQPQATEFAKIAGRRASTALGQPPRPISFAELSVVLSAMYGGAPEQSRRVPSSGGLYPLAIHALVRDEVDPIEPGLWWYDPAADALRLVRRSKLELTGVLLADPLSDAVVDARRPVVFISADLERVSRKYANRGYRWALMETGAAMQNAYLVAAELRLPVRAIGGIFDDAAHAFLELPDEVVPLLALLLGS